MRRSSLTESPSNCIEAENVRFETESCNHSCGDTRNHARVAKLLTRMRIRDVDLDERKPCASDLGCSIPQRVGVVSKSSRVHDYRRRRVNCLVQPRNQLGFAVGLTKVERQRGRVRETSCVGLESGTKVSECSPAVNVRLATAESTEVGPVEDKYLSLIHI